MPIPGVSISFEDNALGLSAPVESRTVAFIGTCSSGTANTVLGFKDKARLKAALGTGQMVEVASLVLDVAKNQVVCVKAPSSVVGTKSSVTKTGTGTATLALTGTPLDAYDAIVEIIAGAADLAAATASFRYSLDGGITFTPELAMPISGVYSPANTGLTLTFTNGVSGVSFVAGTEYTFTTTAPGYSLSELNTALDALLATDNAPFIIHVVGPAADASAAAAMLAALDVKLQAAAGEYEYARAIMEMPNVTRSAAKTAMVGSSPFVSVAYGMMPTLSVLTGQNAIRSIAWTVVARLAAIAPKEDPGWVGSPRGPLQGAVVIRDADGSIKGLTHDERTDESMSTAGFLTVRTVKKRKGVYCTGGQMFIAATSDYSSLPRCRVIDVAAGAAYLALSSYIMQAVEVSETTGKITPAAKDAIEKDVAEKIRAAVVRTEDAIAVSFTLDPDENILSTETLRGAVRVQPYGYARFIVVPIGFTNPALNVVTV